MPGVRESVAPATYLLEWENETAVSASAPPGRCLTLLVTLPRSTPGYATSRIAYVREPHRLEYFAEHQWADTPARMLEPIVVQALLAAGYFRNVIAGRTPVEPDLRLDSEVLALRQIFENRGSRIEFRFRVEVFDLTQPEVLGERVFAITEPSEAPSPSAGVAAANRAVARLMNALGSYLAEVTRRRRAACPGTP